MSVPTPSMCNAGRSSGPSFPRSFADAFTLCSRPAATDVLAASSHVYGGQENKSCWLEHGHLGAGRKKTSSTSTGSGVALPSAKNDCAPVLSASERLHGRAGVRDVSLPVDPVSWRLVTSGWIRPADRRNLYVTRMLNHMTPGCWCRCLVDSGWLDLLQGRGPGGGGRGSDFGVRPWHGLDSFPSSRLRCLVSRKEAIRLPGSLTPPATLARTLKAVMYKSQLTATLHGLSSLISGGVSLS